MTKVRICQYAKSTGRPQNRGSGIISGMPSRITEKVRENRLRRAAQRQWLRLEKSRRRDPLALGFGLYALVDQTTGAVAHDSAPWGTHVLDLDDVERLLTEKGTRP